MVVKQYSTLVVLSILSVTGAAAQTYNINAFAGNATSGFSGDSGPATSAQLNYPLGIVVDSSGKVYISDSGNNRVRVVSSGSITTFAGTGTAGDTGDKSSATKAEINSPAGLALDPSGNLYIVDYNNNVVRQVSTSGTITTFAGTATTGYTGDGGAATSATMLQPTAIAFDSAGDAFICDTGNNVIREVYGPKSTVGTPGNIQTIVGGIATIGQLSHPAAIAVDANGNLYIADTNNRRIVFFQVASSTFTVLAGNELIGFSGDNGPALQATLFDPQGIAVDSHGNVYIADTLNGRIRVVSAATGNITTIAGNGSFGFSGDGGSALSAAFYFPRTVAVDASGNIYVGDTINNEVRILTAVAPHITSNGVVNAASYLAQLSPGAFGSVFGSGFGGGSASAGAPLPTNFGGISVMVNGKNAPILSVSPQQINFQVPWETSTGNATVQVSVNGTASNTISVPVSAAGPGLFSEGGGRVLAQNSDYSLNFAHSPEKAGSTITTYVNGAGPIISPVGDGSMTPMAPPIYSIAQLGVKIGSQNAQVAFAGLAPGMVGLLQLNIVVPSDLATGDYPLSVSINGETSNSGVITLAQ